MLYQDQLPLRQALDIEMLLKMLVLSALVEGQLSLPHQFLLSFEDRQFHLLMSLSLLKLMPGQIKG